MVRRTLKLIFISMMRYVKHNGMDYLIVDNVMEVDKSAVPFRLQVKVNTLSSSQRLRLYNILSQLFDKQVKFNKPEPSPKVSWWQRLFKR